MHNDHNIVRDYHEGRQACQGIDHVTRDIPNPQLYILMLATARLSFKPGWRPCDDGTWDRQGICSRLSVWKKVETRVSVKVPNQDSGKASALEAGRE